MTKVSTYLFDRKADPFVNKSHVLITNKKRGWNGEAAMIEILARGLLDRGYQVSLATNPKAVLIERLADTDVEILELTLLKQKPQILYTMPNDIRKLSQFIRDRGVNLIHSHASFDTWTTALTLRLCGIDVPLVRTKHNMKPVRKTWLNRWYYGKAMHSVIAVSSAVLEDLHGLEFLDRAKVHYIANGIEVDKVKIFEQGRAKAREELAIPADAEVVAYVSRVVRRKDPATLVKAALELRKTRPKLRLLIVGGGDQDYRAELEAMAQDCTAVEFWGHRDDVPRIMAAIDVLVLPALVEAFGLAPLEAMLQGVTTVVSDAEGFRDFVKHERTGMVFPRQDSAALAAALDRVLTDGALIDTLKQGGERIVRDEFNSVRMVDEIDELYQGILHKN